MPTDTRLLYVLSDLAYIAKLIPGKKAHDFVLSDFRQVNGEFLDENLLLEKNLAKLFGKLEDGSYKLILPDFLFTSTIINIELDNEEAVKEHLTKKLLPELGINDQDYYLDTTVLSNYKGFFKVQLTALEKTVVSPLAQILKDHKNIKIDSISPLSWTSKSIISLEPSVAILQMGNHLFLAEHYIGVDQCYSVEVAEGQNFAETVQTLKGAEPSLQTVYLLTNSLVDDSIKEKLKETLPVQQLADLASENESMPSYVRQIIESGAKTFSIPEFLLPQFVLDKNYKAKDSQVEKKDDEDLSNLVKPAVVGASVLPTPLVSPIMPKAEVAVENLDDDEGLDEVKKDETADKDDVSVENPVKIEVKKSVETETEVSVEATGSKEKLKQVQEADIDFSQFANLALDPSVFNQSKQSAVSSDVTKDRKGEMNLTDLPEKKIIRNKDDGSSITKMIFIGFLSFVVTIALGVGIGLAYLQWTNRSESSNPTVEIEPIVTPVVEVTATPTPLPEIKKADYKISVVNATTKAGYASTIVTKLKTAEFTSVTASNAKGIYEKGDYLLVKEDNATNQALLKELEKASELTLTLKTDINKEDASGAYSAVLVLGQ
jgi:hypothetical protein